MSAAPPGSEHRAGGRGVTRSGAGAQDGRPKTSPRRSPRSPSARRCWSARRSSSPRRRSPRRRRKLVKGAVVGVAAGVFFVTALFFVLVGCAWLLYYYLPSATTSPTSGASSRWPLILLVLGALAGLIAAKAVKQGAPPVPDHGDRGGAQDPRDRFIAAHPRRPPAPPSPVPPSGAPAPLARARLRRARPRPRPPPPPRPRRRGAARYDACRRPTRRPRRRGGRLMAAAHARRDSQLDRDQPRGAGGLDRAPARRGRAPHRLARPRRAPPPRADGRRRGRRPDARRAPAAPPPAAAAELRLSSARGTAPTPIRPGPV